MSLQQQVQELYVGYLGRAAELNGLNFWVEGIEAGTYTLADVAQQFTVSPEYTSQYDGLTTTQFVAKVYENVLGRTADGEGLTFWVNALETGVTTDAGLVAMMLANLGSIDQLNFDNRTSAAQAYTDEAGEDYDLEEGIAVVGGSNAGDTSTLTAGADTVVGTSANDTINALSIGADGQPATTFSAFDSIDGGAGNDTLNIYTTATENTGFPANVSVKNVETINIHNSDAAAALGDASKFVGATAINQIGANAADVTNLAAGTTAGFNSTTQADINVSAAASAATANVVLTNVAEATSLTVGAAAGGVLNSVTVSGTRVDATPTDAIDNLDLTVVAGKNVESVSITTAIDAVLTVGNEAGSATAVSTVDASASTGDVEYDADATVANIKTGSGSDVVVLNTALNATVKAATVITGAGDDVVVVGVTVGGVASGQTVTADAGEGNDLIDLTITAGVGYNVTGGAGDDTVVITGAVKSTDKIDGGEGSDTVSLAGKATFVADDYIVFNKVLTNFETLQLTGIAATLDASQLAANYSTIDLFDGSTVSKVGTQALVANGDLTATAAGTDVAAATKVYAGTLNISAEADGVIDANAERVNLTVDASEGDVAVELAGFAKSANVTLVQELNADETDYVGYAGFELETGTAQSDLASLTLSGNGYATVFNGATGKLVTVDASDLDSVGADGEADMGLFYFSQNAQAETIKLGDGIDNIVLSASTYGAADTIEGLNLVASAADAKVVDLAVSDDVTVMTDLLAGPLTGFAKFTTTQTDLDLALLDAAKSDLGDKLVFQLGGDTYIYGDVGATADVLDASDVLVKLTGAVDLDLLIDALDL